MSLMPGGWTEFDFTISDDAMKVFDAIFGDTVKKIIGVTYKPLAVATQVVAGTNYCFLCEGTLITQQSPTFAAKVYIFSPLSGQGDPVLKGIERVEP